MKLVYRGVVYQSPTTASTEFETSHQTNDVVPKSFLYLKYRGVPYIRFCY